MEKQISITGMNGTFEGTISIKFNDRNETKEVHNGSRLGEVAEHKTSIVVQNLKLKTNVK